MTREMISFMAGAQRFNFRAAGIALREGYVLVQRDRRDDFWALPGGRVEKGEAGAAALAREVEEELGIAGTVGPLRFVMENFFAYNGTRFHEIGFYYALDLPDAFSFSAYGAICHRCVEAAVELEFKWVPAEPGALAAHEFQPADLRGRIGDRVGAPEHLVRNEIGA